MTRLALTLALLLLPAALFADEHFQEQIDQLVERVGDLEEGRAEDKQKIAGLEEENAQLKQKAAEGKVKDDEHDTRLDDGEAHDEIQDNQSQIGDFVSAILDPKAIVTAIVKIIAGPARPYYADEPTPGPGVPIPLFPKPQIDPIQPLDPSTPEPESERPSGQYTEDYSADGEEKEDPAPAPVPTLIPAKQPITPLQPGSGSGS